MSSEDETLEYKRSLDIKKIVQSVAAFANTTGGTILVGMEDDGGVVGVDVGKRTVEHLTNEIVRNTDPPMYPTIRVEEREGKSVIRIKVGTSGSKPVLAYGRGYKRVGRSNHKLSREELIRMGKGSGSYYWDEEPSTVGLSEIDEEKLRGFLRKVTVERRMDIDVRLPVREALEKLNALDGERLRNAAVLMFSTNPQDHFLQSELRCARFKGTNTTSFIDVKELGGGIGEQVPKAVNFIKEHIRLGARIEGIERVEEWEYPIEALREAVVNAICHRDYEDPGNVQIRIFDDRVEVWSPGLLPEGITPRLLEESHRSIPRNRLVANYFFLMKYIEKWGTGTNRIIAQCREHGLPKPRFEEKARSFVVSFHRHTQDYVKSLGLNPRQLKAVDHIITMGRITNREYMEFNHVSRNTATNDLMELVKKGILRQTGTGRGSFYEFS